MTHRALLTGTLLLCISCSRPKAPVAVAQSVPSDRVSSTDRTVCTQGPHASKDPHRQQSCEMIDYINADRAFFSKESGGGAPLSWNPDLWTVAVAHSQDMCDRAYFKHENKKGQGPQERAERAGFAYYVAENISVNKDVAATMHGLMAEPTCTGHRGNILTPRAVSVGIGIITCDNPRSQWHGYWIITQNFEWDFANSESSYCQSARTSCELPSDPVSTASEHCSDQANSWGWCSYEPGEIMDESWGCPRD